MTKTFIRVELCSEGESPKQIVERMRGIGAVPLVGDYDFELSLAEDMRLFDKLEEIHQALRGSNVRYTVTTRTDAEAASIIQRRHEATHYVGDKPVELKKAVYRAKLERWKEMGLDVGELEGILETDLDKFKEVSREFLRTHLDEMSVVKDKRSDDNLVDGKVLALLDENGKTLEEIIGRTGFSEEQVMLSLGRLISSESARRVAKDGMELYCLVPPPAPVMRKPLQLNPAKDDSEAEGRVLDAIPDNGISSKDVIRTSRMPREQVEKAAMSLKASGKIRIVVKGRKVIYYRM
ncbi:MAG: hypothetical protein JW880_06215 [Candidatus Thermoplasmatota archaeon]|nr:hypothetical protein [Candidatus Thermoplasmatota archaeon]